MFHFKWAINLKLKLDFYQTDAWQVQSRTQAPQSYWNFCCQKVSLMKSHKDSDWKHNYSKVTDKKPTQRDVKFSFHNLWKFEGMISLKMMTSLQWITWKWIMTYVFS